MNHLSYGPVLFPPIQKDQKDVVDNTTEPEDKSEANKGGGGMI